MNNIVINIALDFSDAPGARYRTDGAKSGQEFYEDILKPRFDQALNENLKLKVILDGSWGYASSFLSESFGKLSTKYGKDNVLEKIEFISEEEPYLIDYIKTLVRDPYAQ